MAAAMVAGALYLGPPNVPTLPAPAPQARTAPDATLVGAATSFSGVVVRSFGPVPGCGDDAATSAIVAFARSLSGERISGLADIQAVDHPGPGVRTQWDCTALIETGRGQHLVRYQIRPVTQGHNSWELTIPKEPAAYPATLE